jgi:hypothetical protein
MANGMVRFSKSGGSGGGVTSVTGTAPVVSSGGATPAISMPVGTTSADGYLSSTKFNDFNRKFGGFTYQSYFTGASPVSPATGNAFVYFSEGDAYEMRISYTTQDGVANLDYYFINNRVGKNAIIIQNASGQITIFTDIGSAVDNGTYCTISIGNTYSGADPTTFDNTVCNWTFTQNPLLGTINSLSLYDTNVTIQSAMVGNLSGNTIGVLTVYLGAGSITANSIENNRSVSVGAGKVIFLYLKTAGTMTGSMAVTLMKNGVATAMTFTIPLSSAAAKYSTNTNQVTTVLGDELSLRVVQSTATSSGVLSFGFIMQ